MSQTQAKLRSPYFLETAKGNIELSKGMYLSLLRKKKLEGIKTKKKSYEASDINQQEIPQGNCKTISRLCQRTLQLKKIINKTTKKFSSISKKKFEACSVTLFKRDNKFSFKIFNQLELFPKELSQFYVSINLRQIPIDYDNDCQSDEQQIQKSLNNILMSLCLATYQNKTDQVLK